VQLKLFEPFDPPARIVFVRHRRARRFVMRVLDDGTVRVTLPRWAAKRDAQAFVNANTAWIADQRARRRARHDVAPPSVLRPMVQRWQRRKAERELPAKLLALARLHGIDVAGVSIRDQRFWCPISSASTCCCTS
jgi:predicted metal-dependent hydrolase